jgi:hypothetical protein
MGISIIVISGKTSPSFDRCGVDKGGSTLSAQDDP